ncbi:MAG: CCA tRNA nucleotidyltransferase [Flavobacteriaceae bacterium]|nr:CCA tRNA nucleotidyltransferase [Flavobacteriaceae bacterium]
MGTPKEDAFRRDFTVNSLFFNINTEKIEDFTSKGLEDMQNKIMRTPLDPYQTFIDDPLRILRGFRFASRLDF